MFVGLRTVSTYVAQAGLELTIFLSHSPEGWLGLKMWATVACLILYFFQMLNEFSNKENLQAFWKECIGRGLRKACDECPPCIGEVSTLWWLSIQVCSPDTPKSSSDFPPRKWGVLGRLLCLSWTSVSFTGKIKWSKARPQDQLLYKSI